MLCYLIQNENVMLLFIDTNIVLLSIPLQDSGKCDIRSLHYDHLMQKPVEVATQMFQVTEHLWTSRNHTMDFISYEILELR